MGEEAKAEETKTEVDEEKSVSTDKGPGLKDEDIRDNIDDPNADLEFEPLFDDESISEALLKGEEEDATGKQTADPEPKGETEDPKKADEKTDAEKEAEKKAKEEADAKKAADDLEKRAKEAGKTVDEIKAEDEAKAKAEAEKEKPDEKDEQISGLNTALRQERKTTKQLKARVAELEASTTKDAEKDAEKDDEFKDFKVLSNAEYDELLDDDPDEAARYLYKFNRYQDHQRKIEQGQLEKHKLQSAMTELVNDGIDAMEKIIPGITKGEAKEDAKKLTEFAIKIGFDNDVLSALTDPGTRIITRDNDGFILSDGAAMIVSAIKSAYDASSVNKDQIRKEVEAELRPIIEAEVQKTLIEKLQKDPESGFRSLDMGPGSGLKDTQIPSGPLSEADYARLTPKEREALLGAQAHSRRKGKEKYGSHRI